MLAVPRTSWGASLASVPRTQGLPCVSVACQCLVTHTRHPNRLTLPWGHEMRHAKRMSPHFVSTEHVSEPVMMPLHLLPLLVVLGSARIFTDAAALDVQHLLAEQRSLEPFTAMTLPPLVADVLTATPEGRRCADTASIPIAGLNLTAEEIALLPQLCWHADEVTSFPEPARVAGVEADSRGIPPDVVCKHTQWCAARDCGASQYAHVMTHPLRLQSHGHGVQQAGQASHGRPMCSYLI